MIHAKDFLTKEQLVGKEVLKEIEEVLCAGYTSHCSSKNLSFDAVEYIQKELKKFGWNVEYTLIEVDFNNDAHKFVLTPIKK